VSDLKWKNSEKQRQKTWPSHISCQRWQTLTKVLQNPSTWKRQIHKSCVKV